MSFLFVVTNTSGAVIWPVTKVVESPSEVVFYADGEKRQAIPRRDILVFQECVTLEEAQALLENLDT